jgi:hypothetical protein
MALGADIGRSTAILLNLALHFILEILQGYDRVGVFMCSWFRDRYDKTLMKELHKQIMI